MLNLNFPRPFVWFSYQFKDVRAIECRSRLEALSIEEVGTEFLDDVRSKAAEVMEHGNKVYALRSGTWTGFVVGGIVSWHEDEETFFAPSKLIP